MNQGYPAIPAAGTGVGSLVSVSDYERVTGDIDNCNQNTIDQAVIEVCQFCNRTLGYGTYTETLFVNRRGYVYPSALPLDPAAPTLPESSAVQGPGLWIGLFAPIPVLPIFSGVIAPQAIVGYSGGYQKWGTTDGPTPQLPPKLMRAICSAAWHLSNPITDVPAFGNITSISLQGVSVSGTLTPMASWQDNPGLVRTLKAYQRREIPAFGN